MQILIWGTGKIAKYYVNLEYFIEHEIVGFVDTYKTNRLFMGYPVYRPQEILALKYDYLIVCVVKDNSAILRTCIAEKINLKKILFVSQKKGLENIENRYLNQLLYKEDILHIFPALYKDIEERYSRYNNCNNTLEYEFKDDSLIHNLGKSHVVVWIPIELLFSQKQEDNYLEVYTEKWLLQNQKWENVPIISLEPHRNLFYFFMYGLNYPTVYCEWFQKIYTSRNMDSGYTDEQIIEKRFREFKKMQHELNRGMDFFIEHPAIAKWNDRGYFNLMDGHHRVCFLYYTGLTKIPVQITRKDYDIWCNMKMVKVVKDTVSDQKWKYFYQPILNPYFFNIVFFRDNYVKSRLHHILEYFAPKYFANKKIIDIEANMGYMGQAFYRMGAQVTMLESDIVHYELMKKVNELMYIKCVTAFQKFEEYETKEEYDVAILLTVFCQYFSKEMIKQQFIERLNKNVKQMIIWESGDYADEEKEYIIQHTKFHNYKRLCYTFSSQKYRELGIFINE